VTLLSHQIRFCSSSSHEETHLHKADHKETLPSSDSHYSNPYVAKLKKHELFHGDFEEIFHDESPDTSIKEIDEEDPYKYHGYKGEIPKTIQGKRVFTREEVIHNFHYLILCLFVCLFVCLLTFVYFVEGGTTSISN
jgi:hypothetical protein